MGALDGRVAIITGAGRGLGREYALLFAAEGAGVVVNDLGRGPDGSGSEVDAAEAVVDEIIAAGGHAVASHHDVCVFAQGEALVQAALSAFGRLDVLVNNAGVLRDRAVVTMEEEDWDVVMNVHLKGHFVPTRWAADHWRQETKAGRPVQASIVHTSSTSGLFGNPGQSNYGAAKAGIAAYSAISATELSRYGVRSNCVVPAARTRLTEATPGLAELVAAPDDDTLFDRWDPGNVAPVVAYLATADCPLTGTTLFVQGGTVRPLEGWRYGAALEREERWSIAELAEQLPSVARPTGVAPGE